MFIHVNCEADRFRGASKEKTTWIKNLLNWLWYQTQQTHNSTSIEKNCYPDVIQDWGISHPLIPFICSERRWSRPFCGFEGGHLATGRLNQCGMHQGVFQVKQATAREPGTHLSVLPCLPWVDSSMLSKQMPWPSSACEGKSRPEKPPKIAVSQLLG